MPIRFNHMILAARDAADAARFTAEILGLGPPRRFGHFHVVDLADEASVDYMSSEEEADAQHVAFLVSDVEFDAILARIRERCIDYWADPRRQRPGEINHYGGGRGLYFLDPGGNYLECITRPYPKA